MWCHWSTDVWDISGGVPYYLMHLIIRNSFHYRHRHILKFRLKLKKTTIDNCETVVHPVNFNFTIKNLLPFVFFYLNTL